MQPNTFSINLDLINHEYVLVDGIKVTSGDTEANVFNINLMRDFVPVNLTGITAVIVFSKPDRKIVYQNLTPVDLTTGKFTCTLSSQTILVPGEVKSEVVLYEGTKRLTSTRFKFIVKKGLLDETAVESSNEFTALTEALGTVNQYDSRITTVEQDQAAHEAESATKHINESGSNSNGRYIKFDDGTMICSADLVMTYLTTNFLRVDWTFPALFLAKDDISLSGNIDYVAGLTNKIIFSYNKSSSTSSHAKARINGILISGQSDFVESDTVVANVIAIGRWK